MFPRPEEDEEEEEEAEDAGQRVQQKKEDMPYDIIRLFTHSLAPTYTPCLSLPL